MRQRLGIASTVIADDLRIATGYEPEQEDWRRFTGPVPGAQRSGIMVTMNGDDAQNDADRQHLAGSGYGEPPGAHDENGPAKRPEFRLLTLSDSGEVADDPQDQLALSVARNLVPQLQAAFTQQLQPVLDAFRVQLADSIGQTLPLQLELIIARQLEVFRELARSVMPRPIELQPLNLLTDLFPPNWKDVPDLDIETVIGIVLDEGIPLVWVPRPAIVTELISAADADTRDGILSSSRDDIALDCLAVIGEITDAKLKPLAGLAAEAVTALQARHSSSAQALAGNVFDTLLRDATRRGMIFAGPPGSYFRYAKVRKQITPVSDDTVIRQFRPHCVLSAALAALQDYDPSDPSPGRFVRHATAHCALPARSSTR